MTVPLAQRLREAGAALEGEHATLRDVLEAHGGGSASSQRAACSLVLMLAVACALPIPGVGTLLGLALMSVAWAMWRHGEVALPERAAALPLPRRRACQLLSTLAHVYEQASRVSRQRLTAMVDTRAERCVIAVIALMALLIVLPIPFGNVLPAIAVALFGLALALRDGALVLAGGVVAGAACMVPVGMAWGAWQVAGWGLG